MVFVSVRTAYLKVSPPFMVTRSKPSANPAGVNFQRSHLQDVQDVVHAPIGRIMTSAFLLCRARFKNGGAKRVASTQVFRSFQFTMLDMDTPPTTHTRFYAPQATKLWPTDSA